MTKGGLIGFSRPDFLKREALDVEGQMSKKGRAHILTRDLFVILAPRQRSLALVCQDLRRGVLVYLRQIGHS